jgi:ATP-binding cassette subfamily B protein
VHTLGGQKGGIAIGVAVGLIWTSAKVVIPSLVQQAIDQGITPGDLDAIRRYAVLIAGAAVVAAVFTGLRRYWAFRESRRAEARLRDRLFAHLQSLHFAYHDRYQTGDLMSRGNTDLQQVQSLVVLIPLTIANAMTVIAVTVVLVLIDPLLTLLALGALPLLNLLGTRFSRRLHPEVMGIQRESADVAAVVEESVSGVRAVKGFAAEAAQSQRLRSEADALYDVSMRAARVRARFLPAMELLPNLGLIMVLLVGGHRVLADQLTLGELIAFNAYIVLLVWPLRMLGMIVAQGQRAVAAAERVDEVLATDPAIVDRPGAAPLPGGDHHGRGHEGLGRVQLRGVRFNYEHGPEVAVLDGLDLEIEPGETVALVGATGSGKSTVARVLPRFYDVDEGEVLLDGVELRTARLADLRRAVGIVFEDTFLFQDSVAANISFADPEASPEAIERAARLAGAHEFISALPDGYDTTLGERGFSLSGGQRQRVAIARAILADPRVLILDDATSAVDPTKEHEIRAALEEVMAGRTTLVIAHRPATIALADRVVLLDGGRVAATGTHAELLASNATYRQVLAAAEHLEPEGGDHGGDAP